MVDEKFLEKVDYIYSFMPDLNTLPGFLFYSFLCYLMVLFVGWLLNPAVDETLEAAAK